MPKNSESNVATDRFLFFNDAVFAIAITLLALEIKLPSNVNFDSDASVLQGLMEALPHFFGFVLSFLIIGMYWILHLRKYSTMVGYNATFLFLNLIFLMAIAFMPFPTSLMSESATTPAVILYAASLAVASIMAAVTWVYAARKGFVGGVSEQFIRQGTWGPLTSATIFLGSIVIALFDASLAMWSWWLLVPALRLVR